MKQLYKLCSTQINLPEPLASAVHEWIVHNIPEDQWYVGDKGNGTGIEDKLHCTVLYGISNEQDKERIGSLLDAAGLLHSVPVILGKLSCFEQETHDVVFITVHGGSLEAAHNLIQDKFETEQTYPEYQPHVTLAYVKKGMGSQFEGLLDFDGLKFASDVLWSNGTGLQFPLLNKTYYQLPTMYKSQLTLPILKAKKQVQVTRRGKTFMQTREVLDSAQELHDQIKEKDPWRQGKVNERTVKQGMLNIKKLMAKLEPLARSTEDHAKIKELKEDLGDLAWEAEADPEHASVGLDHVLSSLHSMLDGFNPRVSAKAA